MKPNTDKQPWGKQASDWTLPLLISLGIIFVSVLVIGPLLFSIDSVSKKFVMRQHCPDAVDITENLGPITTIGSDPNSFGQTVEGVCKFADGSEKIISNDDYAVTNILGSIILGAIVGVGIAIIFMSVYIFLKKKATN